MNSIGLNFNDFWLLHAPIFSILIPLFTAIALIALGSTSAGQQPQDRRIQLRRAVSITSAILGVLTAISYLGLAQQGHIVVYQLGEWQAPFGIVLVLDRLSALMLLLSSSVGLLAIVYASHFWDMQGRYFHAMLHFLLTGLHGAFLTGDLFNLFVFFEILLVASYVLLIHGQGKARFQTAIHYVSLNLLASAIFLIGLGFIYGNVGSLNMTDVARLMPTLSGTPLILASVGALLLFVVFAIKAAMLPVGFWLPKTYAVASTPVVIVFTLMTKVGVYAMLRVNGLVFASGIAFNIWQTWLLVLALLGSLYGVLGAFAAQRLKLFVGFMLLSSVSTLLLALALGNTQALAAMLYYLLHSTLVTAAFYVLCEWMQRQRGIDKDHLRVGHKMPHATVLGACFFLLAWIMAGLPPFSGFMGKLMLLQASLSHRYAVWIIFTILLVSLLSIVAFSRVGFILFWKARASAALEPAQRAEFIPARNPLVLAILCSSLVLMLVFTPQIYRYCLATAQQLMQPALYQNAILKRDANAQWISTQRFDSSYVPENKKTGKSEDSNAQYIPYILSPATRAGSHVSEQKLQAVTQQHKATSAELASLPFEPFAADKTSSSQPAQAQGAPP